MYSNFLVGRIIHNSNIPKKCVCVLPAACSTIDKTFCPYYSKIRTPLFSNFKFNPPKKYTIQQQKFAYVCAMYMPTTEQQPKKKMVGLIVNSISSLYQWEKGAYSKIA